MPWIAEDLLVFGAGLCPVEFFKTMTPCDWLLDGLIWICPDAHRPWFNGTLCAPISNHGSLVKLLKLQMAPKPKLLISSGSMTPCELSFSSVTPWICLVSLWPFLNYDSVWIFFFLCLRRREFLFFLWLSPDVHMRFKSWLLNLIFILEFHAL